jgi:hypothetical protein
LPHFYQILAEYLEIHKPVILFGIRKNCCSSGINFLFYPYLYPMALRSLKNLDLPEFIILPLYKKCDKVVIEEYQSFLSASHKILSNLLLLSKLIPYVD